MATRSMDDWLDAYGESHQNPTNKKVHFVCVPVIFFTIVGFLWAIPFPALLPGLNWASLALVFVTLYYLRLSPPIALGMLVFSLLCLSGLSLLEGMGISVFWFSLVVFVLAWIGQFWGHKVEGKKPSFFEDIQYLMIGPAWIMGFLYRKWGIKY
ncbi:MAG: Mpo1-like protein [Pseudomonadota bacterium]|jgi:uncharacterized membrane protein YGL010W|uniref:Mpo1 family 2-hydroxy fatty acid dioxygenase n=1 Tax=Alcanivorax sp. TaxID=1872427 RepID=UPI0024394721|nr:Mpo1-like protein [Alcanivorax sp.]MED5239043.1 Mpo1-like protein [Pseudomonadota bacterium]MEE3322023.1 Mpo1-like protein [Pseudomonadota bacterium]